MHKSSLLIGSLSVLLVGCSQQSASVIETPTGASSSSMEATSSSVAAMSDGALSVTLTKTVTEGTDGVTHTKATLELTGAVQKTVDLGEITGELMYVNPTAYTLYKKDNADTAAVLSAWFGGAGDEIVITQIHDPHHLTIEQRSGDEQGTCTALTMLADVTLPGDVTISWTGLGDPIAQSSLQFCLEKK